MAMAAARSHTNTLKPIDKKANFRSPKPIVNSLNLIRPELAQAVKDPAAPGEVHVFHTNGWGGHG